MQTICIFTYERSGSGWLCDIFNGKNSISVHEIFSEDPTLLLLNSQKILKQIYNIDEEFLSTIYKIYDCDNFFINPINYQKIKNKILSKNIYNISLLKNIKNICLKNKYNFIFKIFPQHLNNHITINSITEISDHIIINYRKNVLHTFISLQLAKQTGKWYSTQKRDADNKFLIWNTDNYLKYFNKIISNIEFYKNNLPKNKPYSIITYEDIHENKNIKCYNEKISYIKKKFTTLDINYNTCEFFKKQNDMIDYKKIFINHKDFLDSINNIPIYIEE